MISSNELVRILSCGLSDMMPFNQGTNGHSAKNYTYTDIYTGEEMNFASPRITPQRTRTASSSSSSNRNGNVGTNMIRRLSLRNRTSSITVPQVKMLRSASTKSLNSKSTRNVPRSNIEPAGHAALKDSLRVPEMSQLTSNTSSRTHGDELNVHRVITNRSGTSDVSIQIILDGNPDYRII